MYVYTLLYLFLFLLRSRVCGPQIRFLLQSVLCFLPEREYRQGPPLQQPEALRQLAGKGKLIHENIKCVKLITGQQKLKMNCWMLYVECAEVYKVHKLYIRVKVFASKNIPLKVTFNFSTQ